MAVSKQISDHPLPQRREPDSSRHRVVVIEDSSDYALLVAEMVRDALGPDTEVLAHPSLAASRRSESLTRADCVLLDLSLPDAIGLEAVTQMREVAPDVPVIVLSGQDSEEMAVQAVHEGAQDYLVKRRADAHLLGRAIRYAIERKRSELELAHRSLHDPLTDLANRSLFTEQLQVALARADRGEHDLAVMFLDLDGFKAVNDALGHEVGDGLLKGVARRLSALVRPGDTVARFGGDEFLVLCDDLADRRHAVLVAERLSGGLVDPFVVDSHEVYLGASIGIALARDGPGTPESLIRDADHAMYEAKRARTRYRVADGGSTATRDRRSAIGSELHRAVERDQLRLYYQPEVDLARKSIFAVEGLLRWQHPDRGMIPPPDFLPAAEDTGAIVPIGEWVLSTACAQLGRWRRDEMCSSELSVSVNLSLRQLCDDGLLAAVTAAIEAAEIPPSVLCLEVAEAVVAVDNERALGQLEGLKKLGVSLSLDDFGAGVSSLEALNRYPLDMLKIDRSLVQRLGDGLRPRRLFESIVAVAHALDLSVVAEGIETKKQLEQIAEVGCDAAQGFYLSRPGAAALIGPTLRRAPAVATA